MYIYSKSRNPINFHYHMSDSELGRIDKCNDLGILFTHNLSFNEHFDNTVASAKKSLNFIFRTCKKIRSTKALFILYNTYVRSKLKFAIHLFAHRIIKTGPTVWRK